MHNRDVLTVIPSRGDTRFLRAVHTIVCRKGSKAFSDRTGVFTACTRRMEHDLTLPTWRALERDCSTRRYGIPRWSIPYRVPAMIIT
jgi:hypothetical protein